MLTHLIGLDAASQRTKFGYALGVYDSANGALDVSAAGLLGDADDPLTAHITPFIRNAEQPLLAVDAPLGWPDGLRNLIGKHRAGVAPAADASKDASFRRHTDVEIRRIKVPLEVGADKIARASFEALRVLGELRELTGLALPLAWTPNYSGAAAIEVYPGATLVARQLACGPYKKKDQRPTRERMIRSMVTQSLLSPLPDSVALAAANDDDVLDAIVCLVAARDFLLGLCDAPEPRQLDRVKRESWIWVYGGG